MMHRVFTDEQKEAVKLAKRLARMRPGTRPSVGRISGPAGSGKTTLLRAIYEELGDALFLTPTGRAALRLREATGLPASTIHRWRYQVVVNRLTGALMLVRRPPDALVAPRSRLVVVDEASMVSRELWLDLISGCSSINCNILLVGDSFQLPPVAPPGEEFSVFSPDFACDEVIELTQVHRQVSGSNVLQAAMLVRAGDVAAALRLLPSVPWRDAVASAADCVARNGIALCYTNKTRESLNAAIRHSFGLSSQITLGEPLLVLKNNYTVDRFNGEIVPFLGSVTPGSSIPCGGRGLSDKLSFIGALVGGTTAILNLELLQGTIDKPQLFIERAARDWAEEASFGMGPPGYFNSYPLLSACLGWAMTCHKAQGSEWDEAFIVLERHMNWSRDSDRRWLYTAITRAKHRVTYSHATHHEVIPASSPRSPPGFINPPPVPRFLVVGDEEGRSAAAAEISARGGLVFMDPLIAAHVPNATEAAKVVEPYNTVVAVPLPSGALSASALPLLSAARAAGGRTSVIFNPQSRTFAHAPVPAVPNNNQVIP